MFLGEYKILMVVLCFCCIQNVFCMQQKNDASVPIQLIAKLDPATRQALSQKACAILAVTLQKVIGTSEHLAWQVLGSARCHPLVTIIAAGTFVMSWVPARTYVASCGARMVHAAIDGISQCVRGSAQSWLGLDEHSAQLRSLQVSADKQLAQLHVLTEAAGRHTEQLTGLEERLTEMVAEMERTRDIINGHTRRLDQLLEGQESSRVVLDEIQQDILDSRGKLVAMGQSINNINGQLVGFAGLPKNLEGWHAEIVGLLEKKQLNQVARPRAGWFS
jgi:hypothetical protein